MLAMAERMAASFAGKAQLVWKYGYVQLYRETVSYTNLDVYKRQDIRWYPMSLIWGTGAPCSLDINTRSAANIPM